MRERVILFLSGAVGVALAALVYFVSIQVSGLLGRFVALREAEIIVFIILLGVALVEMPVMVFGLRTLRTQHLSPLLFYGVNALYIAFAAFYALVQVILFGVSTWSSILVGLCLVRWGSDLVIGNW